MKIGFLSIGSYFFGRVNWKILRTKISSIYWKDKKSEANSLFGKFIEKKYETWINSTADRPTFSHEIFKKWVVPELKKEDNKILFLVIDNMRYDQWRSFEPIVSNYYKIESEHTFFSILPTTTQYARNAIFQG